MPNNTFARLSSKFYKRNSDGTVVEGANNRSKIGKRLDSVSIKTKLKNVKDDSDLLKLLSNKTQAIALFEKESFSAENFMSMCLRNLTEKGVESARSELAALLEQCREDIQKAVHDNHKEFLEASRAIPELEDMIQQLRTYVNNTASVVTNLKEARSMFAQDFHALEQSPRSSGPSQLCATKSLSSRIVAIKQHLQVLLEDLDVAVAEQNTSVTRSLLDTAADVLAVLERDAPMLADEVDDLGSWIQALQQHLSERKRAMVHGLIQRLGHPAVGTTELRTTGTALAALGGRTQAACAMLNCHSLKIRAKQQQLLKLHSSGGGDPDGVEYSGGVAQHTFMALGHAAEDIAAVFAANPGAVGAAGTAVVSIANGGATREVAALLVGWAVSEARTCAGLLRRHVLVARSGPSGLPSSMQCVGLALVFCRTLELSHALSLTAVLEGELSPHIEGLLRKCFKKLGDDVRAAAAEETGRVLQQLIRAQGSSGATPAPHLSCCTIFVAEVKGLSELIMPIAGTRVTAVFRRGILEAFTALTSSLATAVRTASAQNAMIATALPRLQPWLLAQVESVVKQELPAAVEAPQAKGGLVIDAEGLQQCLQTIALLAGAAGAGESPQASSAAAAVATTPLHPASVAMTNVATTTSTQAAPASSEAAASLASQEPRTVQEAAGSTAALAAAAAGSAILITSVAGAAVESVEQRASSQAKAGPDMTGSTVGAAVIEPSVAAARDVAAERTPAGFEQSGRTAAQQAAEPTSRPPTSKRLSIAEMFPATAKAAARRHQEQQQQGSAAVGAPASRPDAATSARSAVTSSSTSALTPPATAPSAEAPSAVSSSSSAATKAVPASDVAPSSSAAPPRVLSIRERFPATAAALAASSSSQPSPAVPGSAAVTSTPSFTGRVPSTAAAVVAASSTLPDSRMSASMRTAGASSTHLASAQVASRAAVDDVAASAAPLASSSGSNVQLTAESPSTIISQVVGAATANDTGPNDVDQAPVPVSSQAKLAATETPRSKPASTAAPAAAPTTTAPISATDHEKNSMLSIRERFPATAAAFAAAGDKGSVQSSSASRASNALSASTTAKPASSTPSAKVLSIRERFPATAAALAATSSAKAVVPTSSANSAGVGSDPSSTSKVHKAYKGLTSEYIAARLRVHQPSTAASTVSDAVGDVKKPVTSTLDSMLTVSGGSSSINAEQGIERKDEAKRHVTSTLDSMLTVSTSFSSAKVQAGATALRKPVVKDNSDEDLM